MIIRKTQKRSEQSTQLLTPARNKNTPRPQTYRPERTERTAFEDLILNPRVEGTDKPSGVTTRRSSKIFTLGSLQKDHHTQCSATKRKPQPSTSCSQLPKNCAKHPSKAATHYILSQSSLSTLYCQKCSIELASKGCQMGRLHPGTDRKKYDEADLDRFMGSLNSVLNELIRRKEESTVNIIRCETEYGRQIEVINQYFGNLQFMLELEKNKHYESILGLKKQAEAELKRLYTIYENCILEMNRILDNIVLGRRATSCYDSILDEYSPKIQKYNEVITMDSSKFTIKQIKLINIDQVHEILQTLLKIQYEQHFDIKHRFSKSPLSSIPIDRESNIKTIVTEYRSAEYEPEQESQSNLITQLSDVDLDKLLASVASPR